MAEEQKTETPQTEEIKSGKVVFESQADFDAVISRRLSKEREKFSDYDSLKEELEKVRQAQKEREEKEMTESQKLQLRVDELKSQITDLEKHKEWRDNWERQETEKIEKAMEDLSDEDKELVNSLPLDKRMIMVNKLSKPETQPKTTPTNKAFKFDDNHIPTTEEYMKIRTEYGVTSPQAIKARELMQKR